MATTHNYYLHPTKKTAHLCTRNAKKTHIHLDDHPLMANAPRLSLELQEALYFLSADWTTIALEPHNERDKRRLLGKPGIAQHDPLNTVRGAVSGRKSTCWSKKNKQVGGRQHKSIQNQDVEDQRL